MEPISNVEVGNSYGDMIANGMRVLHFMDHRPFDVFNYQQHYSSPLFPVTHYSPGYPPGGELTPEYYPPVNASATSTFSPHIIVPQPLFYSNNSSSNCSTNSVGFQPYQSRHLQQCDDSNVVKRYVPRVIPL